MLVAKTRGRQSSETQSALKNEIFWLCFGITHSRRTKPIICFFDPTFRSVVDLFQGFERLWTYNRHVCCFSFLRKLIGKLKVFESQCRNAVPVYQVWHDFQKWNSKHQVGTLSRACSRCLSACASRLTLVCELRYDFNRHQSSGPALRRHFAFDYRLHATGPWGPPKSSSSLAAANEETNG